MIGQEIEASLRELRLIGPDEHPVLTELAGGVSALIMHADTIAGPLCVKQTLARLNVATEWTASLSRGLSEQKYLALAGEICPGRVPRVLASDSSAHLFVMEYLAPELYPNWKLQLRDGLIDDIVAAGLAAMLGRIHQATAGDDGVRDMFANDKDFYDLRLEPYLLVTARAHLDLAEPLQNLARQTAITRIALVHGDFSPKNILVGPRGPVLLDAECACYGDPAFDVAFCVNHLLLKGAWHPEHVRAYLQCYRRFAKDYLAMVTWEPAQALEARAAALLPGLMLARIDGKSPVEYLTEDDIKQRVRRFARDRLRDPPSRLAAIADDWQEEIADWATT